MTTEFSSVFLRAGATGRLVPAELYPEIPQRHLDQHEQFWKPLIAARSEEHGHWDWRRKMRQYKGQLGYQSFSVECEERLQGLMLVNTLQRCRLASQASQHMVYVEYLEAAPWNRPLGTAQPVYKGVGTILLAAAIQLSRDEGFRGRIGLHSLPQADAFYRHCGMTDTGPDEDYPSYPLRYFEMTQAQAMDFIKGR